MRLAISVLLLIHLSNQQDSESCTEIAEEPTIGELSNRAPPVKAVLGMRYLYRVAARQPDRADRWFEPSAAMSSS